MLKVTSLAVVYPLLTRQNEYCKKPLPVISILLSEYLSLLSISL